MLGRKMFLHQYPVYIFICALLLLVYFWHSSSSLSRAYLDQTRADLKIRAVLIKPKIMELLRQGNHAALRQFCVNIAGDSKSRITVIDKTGNVLCDSAASPAAMPNHAGRPEVQEALHGETGTALRFSSTLEEEMFFVATPLIVNEQVIGVLRLGEEVTVIRGVLNQAHRDIILAGCFVALATALISFLLIKRVSMPIERIKTCARQIAAGELDIRIPESSGAVSELAGALNNMAEQLKNRLLEVKRQKNERDAILSSMTEGVVALDSDATVIWVNRAAAEMLGLKENIIGHFFYEAVRCGDIIDFTEKILKEKQPMEEEVRFYCGDAEKMFRIDGAILKDENRQTSGAVLVLSDITEIKRGESFRRDFVANVSHEIRTPLTAIRAAIETLQAGSCDQETAAKFMDIISRHSLRLNSLIDDILCLSSIERTEFKEDFQPVVSDLDTIVDTVVSLCRDKAEKKNISINTEQVAGVSVTADAHLLEQALINLVDNAVKYNPEGSEVKIAALKNNNIVEIRVEDNGIGIAPEHLPRIFERFYRVDKARSRKLGGTGLGLAIVKHIVKLHKGTVAASGEVGKGTTFTIRLPIA